MHLRKKPMTTRCTFSNGTNVRFLRYTKAEKTKLLSFTETGRNSGLRLCEMITWMVSLLFDLTRLYVPGFSIRISANSKAELFF